MMKKEINILEIKRVMRGILKRKKSNEITYNIIEEGNILKVYINDYLVDEVRADKKEDKELLEDIMLRLVEQIMIQRQLNKNKNYIYKYLHEFNKKYSTDEMTNNCNDDCGNCKYYDWCDDREERIDVSEELKFTDEYISKYGVPF